MRCAADDSLVASDKKETMKLYVTTSSFVLVKDDSILEIHFDGHKMTRRETYEPKDVVQKYDIYGIVGFIEGFKEKYMVVISSVQLRGHLMGHPVYVIDGVSCLSFDSYKACQKLDTKEEEQQVVTAQDEDHETAAAAATTRRKPPVQLTQSNSFLTRIKKTFAKKKSHPDLVLAAASSSMDQDDTLIDQPQVLDAIKKEQQDLLVPSNASSISQNSSASTISTSSYDDNDEEDALEQRLIRQVTEMFSRSMFLYSNTCDITNSFQRSLVKGEEDSEYNDPQVPLWKKVDKRFWWNEHLTRDLVTQKLDEWVVPVMQGTLQIEPCQIDGYGFDFVLISRRSRERAGMRYQRRGINEDGQVANFVETEQAVIFKKGEVNHVASFIQTRGSIPVFWSQSPYSLHPVPTLDRPEQENKAAFQKHFETQEKLYGKQIIVNLTELVGREAIVGQQYRHHVEELADPNIKYVEFDFHKETKGMKFENISKLSRSLYDDLSKIQYFWETAVVGDETIVYCRQSGVFRTNCMDCLDRTNVVQSAFGRSVLNLQLMRFGISEYPEQGIKYYDDFERIFNNVWANNGDMISRMYAGTSALKGDFTRTGKRNITGMMNDASNSLARMYFNTIKDFWRQATVDYVLGYHKSEIFRHVPQATKMSAEPGIERRWAKIRADAISISSEIVVSDDETLIQGWTLLSPTHEEPGKQRSPRNEFQEKILLLTEKALYICNYNYALEKVIQFKRLELDTIISIQMGEYILSSLTPASRSEDQNYGLIINHHKDGELVRWNTGSIHNQSLGDINIDQQDNHEITIPAVQAAFEGVDSISFKAVRYNILGELDGEAETCKKQIQDIVQVIAKACGHDAAAQQHDTQFVFQKPIISLEQAEKTDGVFKKMGYKIKRAIWI